MPQPFKDHISDTQVLNQNTVPFSQCSTRLVERAKGEWYKVTDVPILTGECLWHIYQDEAEEIVAPGGVLIADPVERNRAINAAYARLWLADPRFQWAGLAAFASKQVGCGMMHATDMMTLIQEERDAKAVLNKLHAAGFRLGNLSEAEKTLHAAAINRYLMALKRNPLSAYDANLNGGPQTLIQEAFDHVNKMMALGNTTLFLDVYPLHAFYAKRGIEEFRKCLGMREKIFGHREFPILWPVDPKILKFGVEYQEVLEGFEAIDAGDITQSVVSLAWHEQQNILQPTMYSNSWLVALLRGNHVSYVVDFPSGVSQALELTLSSQCKPLDDGRTIGFSKSIFADLSVLTERMPFVRGAADKFDEMMKDHRRSQLEQSIREIAAGAPS